MNLCWIRAGVRNKEIYCNIYWIRSSSSVAYKCCHIHPVIIKNIQAAVKIEEAQGVHQALEGIPG